MQDYLFVHFFLGHKEGDAARRLLADCDLLEVLGERQNRNAWLGDTHLGVSVRLPKEDARLQRLLTRLTERGVDPFTRMDRSYTAAELDNAEWLELRVATAGLLGGVDYGQSYDRTHACPMCGAGSTPMPPLVVDLGNMGKKDLDNLIYEGHLIASKRVADGLAGLTGVDLAPVRSPRKPPDGRWVWLRIQSELSPMESGYTRESACVLCGRAGHYGSLMQPAAPTYVRLPSDLPDFNLSWEYLGDWGQRRHASQAHPVGGSRVVIHSQRVRQRLLELKVRRLIWIPVTVRDVSGSGRARVMDGST